MVYEFVKIYNETNRIIFHVQVLVPTHLAIVYVKEICLVFLLIFRYK